MKKKFKAITGVILSMAIIAGPAVPMKATSIKQAQEKQKGLDKKIKDANQILSELETLKSDTTAYIQAMDTKMEDLTNYIVDLNYKISDKEAQIAETNQTLATQQEDINNQYAAMKLRIRFLYENGQTEYLDMILNSKSISDFLNKAEYLTRITEYDRNMLDRMKDTKKQIEDTMAVLQEEQESLVELKTKAQTEQAQVETLVSAKAAVLEQTNSQISSTQSSVSSMESELSESQAIEAELVEMDKKVKEQEALAEQQRLQREQQEAQEASRAAEEASKAAEKEKQTTSVVLDNSGNNKTDTGSQSQQSKTQDTGKQSSGGSGDTKKSDSGSSSGKTSDTGSGSSSSSGYSWPVYGHTYISSYFVDRINPVTGKAESHSGIDIPAPAGTPVHAIASGTVAWAYRSSSAGNWVGITHGNGIVSVYMHMSGFNCKEGDYVSAGAVIGYVGSTGQSTGNHLHLSIRKNGVNVNPLGYVSQ